MPANSRWDLIRGFKGLNTSSMEKTQKKLPCAFHEGIYGGQSVTIHIIFLTMTIGAV